MSFVMNTVIPVLAGLAFLLALLFIARGLLRGRSVPQNAYGVERQEARKRLLVDLARGIFFVVLGLIFLGIFGLSPRAAPLEATPAPTSTATMVASPTVTLTPTATLIPQILPTPTMGGESSPLESPEATAEVETGPTSTVTPTVPTAVVDSFNGLWLREAPGGSQEVELIPNGTVIELLEGRETADDLEWQRVRTPAGNEGWVAVDFIIIQE